jgi:serine/threonine-protein kinase
MELMAGGSVADVLRRGDSVAHERALRWLREAAGAVDAAHALGVVHRDIKPANLLLDENDRLAVADFGIARLAWEEDITRTGEVLGTAAYIAPEQAMGQSAGAASDRYSLAVVAFELLTGQKPFIAAHFAAQARAHVEDAPPLASDRDPGLNDDVDAVLVKGMAKRPQDRWASCVELVEHLTQGLESRSPVVEPTLDDRTAIDQRPVAITDLSDASDSLDDMTGRLPPLEPPAPATPQPVAARQAPSRPYSKRQSNSRAMAIGALVFVVLVALVAAVALMRRDTGGSGTTTQPTAATTATTGRTGTSANRSTTTTRAGQNDAIPSSNDPTQLQLQAFKLNNSGNAAAALPYAEKAVRLCEGSTQISPCAYALFELARAQRMSGDPAAAIRTLEERQSRFPDDQRSAVEAELAKARAAAGA